MDTRSNLKELFRNLQTDSKSVLFTQEKIDDELLKKLIKSMYKKDTEFVNLFNSNVDFLDNEKKPIQIKTIFAKKEDDIDITTLYSFDGPFQLLHLDVKNLLQKCGKAFAAEQELRELKKRIFRLKALKKIVSKRISPYEIIKKSVDNMNSLPKYKQIPNEIEKNTLSSEADRESFNFSRLKKISQEKNRLERFDKKIYKRKKLKLRSPL